MVPCPDIVQIFFYRRARDKSLSLPQLISSPKFDVLWQSGSRAQDFIKMPEHEGPEVRREIWDEKNIYVVVEGTEVKKITKKKWERDVDKTREG